MPLMTRKGNVNVEENKRFFGSFYNMKKQKYYTLEELKVGMTVSIASLDYIYNTRILLDKESFVRDMDEIGFGKIVSIGEDLKRKSTEGTIVIYNTTDKDSDEE